MAPSSGSAAPTANTLIWQPQQLQHSWKLQETSKQNKLDCDKCLQSSRDPNSCRSTVAYQMSRTSSYTQPALLPSASWEPWMLPWSCLHHSNESCPQTGLKIWLRSWIFCGGNPQHMDASSRHMISRECHEATECMQDLSLSAVKRWSTLQFRNLYRHKPRFLSSEFSYCDTSRRDGRLKVILKFLLCNDWGPKEASTHCKVYEARLWQTSWHTSCSSINAHKYFYAFGKTFIQRKFLETSSFTFHCSIKKMVVIGKWSFSRRYRDFVQVGAQLVTHIVFRIDQEYTFFPHFHGTAIAHVSICPPAAQRSTGRWWWL